MPTDNRKGLVSIGASILSLAVGAHNNSIRRTLLPTCPGRLGSARPFRLLRASPRFVCRTRDNLANHSNPSGPTGNPHPLCGIRGSTCILTRNRGRLRIPVACASTTNGAFAGAFILGHNSCTIGIGCGIRGTNRGPLRVSAFNRLGRSVALPPRLSAKDDGFTLRAFHNTTCSAPSRGCRGCGFSAVTSGRGLGVSSGNN